MFSANICLLCQQYEYIKSTPHSVPIAQPVINIQRPKFKNNCFFLNPFKPHIPTPSIHLFLEDTQQRVLRKY